MLPLNITFTKHQRPQSAKVQPQHGPNLSSCSSSCFPHLLFERRLLLVAYTVPKGLGETFMFTVSSWLGGNWCVALIMGHSPAPTPARLPHCCSDSPAPTGALLHQVSTAPPAPGMGRGLSQHCSPPVDAASCSSSPWRRSHCSLGDGRGSCAAT